MRKKQRLFMERCSNCGKEIECAMPRPIGPIYLCEKCAPLFYSSTDYLNDLFPKKERNGVYE